MNNWRSKQVSLPARGATARAKEEAIATPKIKPRGDSDANLIHFPAASATSTATIDETSPADVTDWRAQVKEKVRQARQKRHSDEPDIERNARKDLEQNPIVQAALNRIKWATPTQTVKPSYAAGRGAAALAEALDPFPEADTFVDPQPASRPVAPAIPPPRIKTNPFSYTTNRVHRTEPKVEPPRQVKTNPPVAYTKPESKPVIPPAAKAAPVHEPKPDLLSYADVATPKATPPPSLTPPLAPLPVLPPTVAPEVKQAPGPAPGPAPGIDEKIEVIEQSPAAREVEKRIETARTVVKSESKGTQVIEIPSIISHIYELVPAPATLWVRSLAAGCDLEILAMAFLPIFAAYATLNTSLGSEALFILGVLLSALVFVYQAVCLQVADRTFGMALLNLKLINTSDENMPITRQQKMLRAWGATLAFLCPPLNLIIMKANNRGLSLPDLISGTSPIEGK